MDIAILSKDDGVNEAVSQGLAESRSAGNGDHQGVLGRHQAKSLQHESGERTFI